MPDSPLRRILRELKRRKVFRVAGAYAVMAWAVIEVAATVAPLMAMPEWAPKIVLFLALFGFPVALVLAWAFELTPDGVKRTEAEERRAGPVHSGSPSPFFRRPGFWLVFGILVILSGVWYVFGRTTDEGPPAPDRTAVAILPFRTAGAAPELRYLREGMVDLLAAKLSGESGPRAADPRRVIAAWRRKVDSEDEDLPRDSALALARELGTGKLLLGAVVGTPGNVVLEASLYDLEDQELQARASVEGSPDSLTALVDRLTGSLLALDAGLGEHRLAALTSRSLPALRAYLEGQKAYRRGSYQQAYDAYWRALDLDPTFALAGIGLVDAAAWLAADGARGTRIAWEHRDRLPAPDRAYLEALRGPVAMSGRERLDRLRRAAELMPERPEVWNWLGELVFHSGPVLGMDEWERNSIRHFERAIALDSTFSTAYIHPAPLLLSLGDTAAALRLAERYLRRDSAASDVADVMRWVVAQARRDTSALARLRRNLDEMTTSALFHPHAWSMFEGRNIEEEAEPAIRVIRRRADAASPSERLNLLEFVYTDALARGRLAEAEEVLGEMQDADPSSHAAYRLRVLAAVYGPGDRERGTAAAHALEQALEGSTPEGHEARLRHVLDLCTLEQWRLWNRRTEEAERSVAWLRRMAEAEAGTDLELTAEGCATLLSAVEATVEGRVQAGAHVARLDSLLASHALLPIMELQAPARMAVVRIHDANGRQDRALLATGRRTHMNWGWLFLYSATLREEGRLAARVGDRERAASAYRHYLALRHDPDPELQDEVDQVRRQLATLVRDR